MTLQDFAPTGNPITETSSSNMERTVIDRDGNTVATLKAEAYASVAMIDYSSILRAMFVSGLSSVGSAITVSKDWNLQVVATIAGTEYIFVRGVEQMTKTNNDKMFKFLTNMPHLRSYHGYPLDVSYMIKNASAQSWYVRLDGDVYENQSGLDSLASILKAHATSRLNTTPISSPFIVDYVSVERVIPPGHVGIYEYSGYDSSMPAYRWKKRTGTSRYEYLYTDVRNPTVGTNIYRADRPLVREFSVSQPHQVVHEYGTLELVNSATVRDSIEIRPYDVPAHPFYVRWVNNLGGWDYFMFACNQKHTQTLSKNDTYEKYINYYGRYGQRSSYNKEATSEVEVSTGTIDRATIESVLECVYSPLVQLYDEVTSSWIEIQPRTDKQEIMADQPTGELIMIFELPTPQINK